MASPTEISNLALGHIGFGTEIANLETERSPEAIACRRFIGSARRATLRDFPWPFAKAYAALSKVADNPVPQWMHSYRYPASCLIIRRLVPQQDSALYYAPPDVPETRIPYEEGQDASGLLVYTNACQPLAEYTLDTEAWQFFPADFDLALSWRLGIYIAPKLTAGDPTKLKEACMQGYQMELSRAQVNSMNGQQSRHNPDSELILSRY